MKRKLHHDFFFCTYSNLRGPEETRGGSSFHSSSPLYAQLTLSPSDLSHQTIALFLQTASQPHLPLFHHMAWKW